MKYLQRLRFLKRFPGPYDYQRSSDGIDETFNVICIKNGRYIISTYFWGSEQHCEMITNVVTSALNRMADWHGFVPHSFLEHLEAFQRQYPGPYDVRQGCCPGRGEFEEVYCLTTNESVIHNYGDDRETRLIARHIADSLTTLRSQTADLAVTT